MNKIVIDEDGWVYVEKEFLAELIEQLGYAYEKIPHRVEIPLGDLGVDVQIEDKRVTTTDPQSVGETGETKKRLG